VRALRALVVGGYFVLALLPLVWMGLTSLKERADTIAQTPRVIPAPVAETAPGSLTFPATVDAYRRLGEVVPGAQKSFWEHLANSAIIGVLSTLASVLLGTFAAYGFSRFRIPGAKDWLFFILSTRFMPPVVVVIPIFLMFRDLALLGTLQGLILVYAAFNLPFTIWMMKGFIDEVPAEYEEAAMLDGYSRLEAFWRVTMPLLVPGIVATAVFALIFSWNEFVFAIFLITDPGTRTAPPAIAGLIGGTTIDWGLVAASAMVFAIPVLVFAFLVRRHLVAGVTLGAVRR
jgi:multiple sugar transport system permease protein